MNSVIHKFFSPNQLILRFNALLSSGPTSSSTAVSKRKKATSATSYLDKEKWADELQKKLSNRPEHERQKDRAEIREKLQTVRQEIAADATAIDEPLDDTELKTKVSVPLQLYAPLVNEPEEEKNNIHHHQKIKTMGKKETPKWMFILVVVLIVSAIVFFTKGFIQKTGWWPFGSSTKTENTTATTTNQKKENKKSSTVTIAKTPAKTKDGVHEIVPPVNVDTTTAVPAEQSSWSDNSVLFFSLLAVGLIGFVLSVWMSKKAGNYLLYALLLFCALSVYNHYSKHQVREKQTIVNLTPGERKFIADSVHAVDAANPIRSMVTDTIAQQQRDTAIQRLADAQNEIAQERLAQIHVIDSLNRIIASHQLITYKDNKSDDSVVQQKPKPQQKPQTKKSVATTARVDKTQTGSRNSTRREDNSTYVPRRVTTDNGYQSRRNGQVDRTQDQQ